MKAILQSRLLAKPWCPNRVISGRDALKFRCPLYPRKRTFAHAIGMSALGRFCCRSRRWQVRGDRRELL